MTKYGRYYDVAFQINPSWQPFSHVASDWLAPKQPVSEKLCVRKPLLSADSFRRESCFIAILSVGIHR